VSSAVLYVLDANVFIEAAKGYYAFDLTPAFWDHLVTHGGDERLCTIERVATEIAFPVPLKTWIDGPFGPCVRSSNTPDTLTHYSALMQWAQAQPFSPAARSEFATVADAWLVAYARAVRGTVVTHETFDANCRRRVKIPNACHFLGVPVVDTFAMLRALGVTFGT